MANKYTEAQKKASLNYQKGKAQIKITVSKEQRERYQQHAERRGITLTQLIVRLLEQDLERAENNAKETTAALE